MWAEVSSCRLPVPGWDSSTSVPRYLAGNHLAVRCSMSVEGGPQCRLDASHWLRERLEGGPSAPRLGGHVCPGSVQLPPLFQTPCQLLPWHPVQNPAGQNPASPHSWVLGLVETWENMPSGSGKAPGVPAVWLGSALSEPACPLYQGTHAPWRQHHPCVLERPSRPERRGFSRPHSCREGRSWRGSEVGACCSWFTHLLIGFWVSLSSPCVP